MYYIIDYVYVVYTVNFWDVFKYALAYFSNKLVKKDSPEMISCIPLAVLAFKILIIESYKKIVMLES
jgi:hypothetical protein